MGKCKYSFLTSVLDGANGQLHTQAALPLGKEDLLSTGSLSGQEEINVLPLLAVEVQFL